MFHLQVVHSKPGISPFVSIAGNSQGDVRVQSSVIDKNAVTAQITVGSTATPLRVGSADLANRKTLMLCSASAFYIGFDTGVTTTNGFLIPANQVVILTFDPDSPVTVYGVAGSTVQVSVIEA